MIDLRDLLRPRGHCGRLELEDHAAELRRAADAGGPIASPSRPAPATLGAVWLVSGDAADCLAELRTAAEAARAIAIGHRLHDLRARAEAVVDGVESLNVCSAEAAPFVRRFEVAA